MRVKRIREPVVHHPNADRLSIVKIDEFLCISAKLEDGSHRYNEGDYVVYIPEASLLPEWMLRRLDMWDEENGKGRLAGSEGNRVKALKLRGIFSQGVLMPVETANSLHIFEYRIKTEEGWHSLDYVALSSDDDPEIDGMDVAEVLGITKYEPPIPVAMAGEVCNVFGHTMKYDFENWQGIPDIFAPGEEVVATEKLHGTNCQIGWVLGLGNEELFGEGDIYVGSKGLSAQGLVMKNNETNAGNLYVRTLKRLLDDGLRGKIIDVARDFGVAGEVTSVHIFGEVFGKGVQDLHYGAAEPCFACFDIALNRHFMPFEAFKRIADALGLPVVPILYEGPFDADVLKLHRDGKTVLGGANIREGIVVKARDGGRHPIHGRKIAKMISPDYLLRKNGSEFT